MFDQTLSGHILRLLNAHHIKNRGSDISKRTRMLPSADFEGVFLVAGLCHHEGHMGGLDISKWS